MYVYVVDAAYDNDEMWHKYVAGGPNYKSQEICVRGDLEMMGGVLISIERLTDFACRYVIIFLGAIRSIAAVEVARIPAGAGVTKEGP